MQHRLLSKRILSCLLVFALSVTMIVGLSVPAIAADDYPYKDSTSGIDDWRFYKGQCTSFVAWCLNSRNGIAFTNQYGNVSAWGHAYNWDDTARSLGYLVDSNPAVGSVAYCEANTNGAGAYGHVAWVSAVNGNTVTVEEYNFDIPKYSYHTRTVTSSKFSGYIHIKDMDNKPPTINMTVTPSYAGPYISVTSTGARLYYQFLKNGEIYAEEYVSNHLNDWDFAKWNLTPGNYEFRVQADRNGLFSETLTHQFSIHGLIVSPPMNPTTVTVTFVDWDGTTLHTTRVAAGSVVASPENPTREGYTFVGWDQQYSMVFSDTTVIAVYKENVPTPTPPPTPPQSPTPIPSEPPVANPFPDVSSGDWFYDAVMYVYERGLMIGMDDGSFAPGETLTREQSIMIVARLAGNDYLNYAGQSPFDDISSNRWSAAAIAWARATGVTNGVGGNKFDPTSLVTIEQFEVMLMRHYNLAERWSGDKDASTRADSASLLYEYVPVYE